MANWTKDPKETGAYWYKAPNYKADIVWLFSGKVFGAINSTSMQSVKNHIDGVSGAMFYGPLDQPPPMPHEQPIKGPLVEVSADQSSHDVALMAAKEWARSPIVPYGNSSEFGKAVAEVYKACLAEIEGCNGNC